MSATLFFCGFCIGNEKELCYNKGYDYVFWVIDVNTDIGMRMPQGVRYIIEMLAARGFEAFAVGGCVRDSMMGRAPSDWDVTTDASPEDMLAVFEKNRVIPTGIQHGTVTILCKGGQFEVTTYRVDGVYSDGRRPESVTFTKSLEEDLKRRDFTINAMAYNKNAGLQDFFGGVADLERRIVRCVGDPKERFAEDYLRMLRAYRFAATLGFELDGAVVSEIAAKREKVKGVSAERIQVELNKLLLSGNFPVIRAFWDVFAEVILPELTALRDVAQNNSFQCYDAYEHTMVVLEHTENDLPMRLAALLHDIGKAKCGVMDDDGVWHFAGHEAVSAKMAVAVLKRLKYDNATIELVVQIIKLHDGWYRPERRAMKRLIGAYGAETARAVLKFYRADAMGKSAEAQAKFLLDAEACLAMLEEVIASGEPCAVADLAVDGKDVMEICGIAPGREVGERLHALLEQVQEDPSLNTREGLAALLVGDCGAVSTNWSSPQ